MCECSDQNKSMCEEGACVECAKTALGKLQTYNYLWIEQIDTTPTEPNVLGLRTWECTLVFGVNDHGKIADGTKTTVTGHGTSIGAAQENAASCAMPYALTLLMGRFRRPD